jgi:hypothetical protein
MCVLLVLLFMAAAKSMQALYDGRMLFGMEHGSSLLMRYDSTLPLYHARSQEPNIEAFRLQDCRMDSWNITLKPCMFLDIACQQTVVRYDIKSGFSYDSSYRVFKDADRHDPPSDICAEPFRSFEFPLLVVSDWTFPDPHAPPQETCTSNDVFSKTLSWHCACEGMRGRIAYPREVALDAPMAIAVNLMNLWGCVGAPLCFFLLAVIFFLFVFVLVKPIPCSKCGNTNNYGGACAQRECKNAFCGDCLETETLPVHLKEQKEPLRLCRAHFPCKSCYGPSHPSDEHAR